MLQKIKLTFNRFIAHPQQLLGFFIAVNLIPSIALMFTEPYSIIGRIILITFPFGIYLLLYSILKNVGLTQLLLIPQLIFNAFQLVLFYLFGESVIAVDMFLNLATTNVTEASELLNNLWPAIILVCIIYIPTILLAAIACKRKTLLPPAFRKKMVFIGLVVALFSYGLTFTATNRNTGSYKLTQEVYPVNVYYNLHFAIQKWQRSMLYPFTSNHFKFNAKKETPIDKREIYILVVGEAGRAINWSLWGYERETNPLLSQTPGIITYKDAITQANATHKSVPLILSAASAEEFDLLYQQKSILQAFKEAGFTTLFFSNQTPNRTFTDYFAAEADYHQNIRPASTGGIYTQNNYDDQLIPLCRHYIDSLSDNLFIVLHTYGSHFNYNARYPRNFAHFQPDNATEVEVKNRQQLINAYDNSIRYTDYFLHSLISLLDSTGSCAALYYSPDHGEDMLDDHRKRFLHASPHPTYYQLHIPLLFWFSNCYRTLFPMKYATAKAHCTQPVSTRIAFHSMLDIAAITTPCLNTDYSIVSPHFKTQRRMYLTDHDTPIFWYNSGLKKQDKEMIEKNHLDHR
ncbi:MAG: lipid A phosphoethanolamine transferase [Odoribacter sp.]